jgi:tetratricopeptide (TPR) repeat protein
MTKVFRTGLIATIALGALWAGHAQQAPSPPPPPAAPDRAPRVAPAPRALPVPAAPADVLQVPVSAIPPIPELPDLPEFAVPASAAQSADLYEKLREDARAAGDTVPPADLQELMENAKTAGAQAKALVDQMRFGPMAFALQGAPKIASADQNGRYYERGQRDLERNRWDDAVNDFGEVVSRGAARADGALYWKAYALNKLGRREDALAAIADLRKNHAASRWLDDAGALEIEIKQAGGKPVSPDASGDEDLKLMALNSFMNSDPDRALPLLEKLLHSSQSPKIKERALFVLTQSGSPKTRQLVVQMAKGGSNPDLQLKAVHYLGVMGGRQELGDVYAATNDVEVKRMALHGLMVAGAKDQMLAAAKGEKNPELRREAIHWLGTMGAEPELWQLYQVEPSLEVKQMILHSLFIGGKTDHLLEVARTAKEPELRQQAIHWLGASGSHQAGDALAAMYGSESNPETKKQIIHALFIQGNGKALVEIARKETNMELKKQIVQELSVMKSKEGTDYLLELLNK